MSRRAEKKHKKSRHGRREGHSRHSESPESWHEAIKSEPEDRQHRHGHRARVKEEPDDEHLQRRIKHEPSGDDGRRRGDMQARQENDARRRERRRQRDQENQEDYNFGSNDSQDTTAAEGAEPVEKEMPNFEVSGKLAEETNTFRGVVIKYSEPPEARKPKKRWRLYPFKEGQSLPVLHIHRQSAFLLGRDRKIADIPIDHPSCSKQHCVLQYRFVPFTKEDGRRGHVVRPYIIDLGSTNGTHVNNQRIEAQRYVELKEQDVLKFGFSSREYVLLHEKSKTDEGEDQGEPN